MSDTPRTDAEEQLMRVDCDDSCVEIYIYRDLIPTTLELADAMLKAREVKP